ncbi:MAG: alternate-type signal peptide domain-containing protein [Aeromicrobium sp.]
MKKSTKGALAASAAGVLLLGGAGSLAYWTADGTADGGVITAGDLKLTDGACGDGWEYADGAASAGDPVVLFVPGDVITQQCTFELQATGDNLTATVNAPTSVSYTSAPDADALTLTADTTFTIGDPAVALGPVVTSENDGDTITATFVVTIPYGDTVINGNDTQDIVASLNDLTVTLTQVDPN